MFSTSEWVKVDSTVVVSVLTTWPSIAKMIDIPYQLLIPFFIPRISYTGRQLGLKFQ